MAKDGTARGGARIGAGQKNKPLYDKILDGNPGKRTLKVIDFGDAADLHGSEMPEPHEYLGRVQKDGKRSLALEIYSEAWDWLDERRCSHLIPALLLEQYAMSAARLIQCEEAISEFGFLAEHPTTGNPMPSPYINIASTYMKQVNTLWFQIYQVVKENSATEYSGVSPHDSMMERLLNSRRC